MALKTTGLKKRKKKVPPSLVRKPRRPPKYVTGPEWGEIVRPAPGKPIKGPKPRPKPTPETKPRPKPKPPQYKPPGKQKPPPKAETKPRPVKGKPIPGLKPKPGKPPKGKPNFGNYVSRHADLAKAFKKHKAKGGTGTAASWGKAHYEKYGKKEKRKLS